MSNERRLNRRKATMKTFVTKLLRSNAFRGALLTVLFLAAVSNAQAQCCCSGIYFDVRDQSSQIIFPEVSAIRKHKDSEETPVRVELKEEQMFDGKKEISKPKRFRLDAGCYGFEVYEISITHGQEQMIIRLRNMPFCECGNMLISTVPFAPGTFELDSGGEWKKHCNEKNKTEYSFSCQVLFSRFEKLSERANP